MRRLAILAAGCVMGTTGSALGNPIMLVDEAYAQQFPGTRHVQLTRLYSMSGGSMEITRDGQPMTATVETKTGPSRDLGSGMTTISAYVACDCHVPLGKHTYTVAGKSIEIDVIEAAAVTSSAPQPSAECDVKCDSGGPPEPQGGSAGEGSAGAEAEGASAGFGEPEPTAGTAGEGGAAVTGGTGPVTGGKPPVEETGGVSSDVAVTGGDGSGAPATGGDGSPSGGATATGGSSVTGGGPAVTGGTPPVAPSSKKSGDSSGCAMAPARGRLGPLGILAALGLLAWRRKK